MATRLAKAAALAAISLSLIACSSSGAESRDEPQSTNASSESPSPTPDGPEICEASSYSDPCTFGQTAICEDSVDGGEMRLEITVLAPVEFTPTPEASFIDNRGIERPALPVNVYFPITIKNVSPELERDTSFVFSQATNESEGDYETLSVTDGEISSILLFDSLAPGQSVSVKNGWSMSTLDGVELEVDIDGLAGYSVTFRG